MRRPEPSRRTPVLALLCTTVVSAVAGCDSGDGRNLRPPVFPPPATSVPAGSLAEPIDTVPEPLRLVAPWRDGAALPVRHTCDGENLSPALTWSNVPHDAVELAVTVTDLDAPDFVHWIVFGIPVATTGLVEGAPPDGASQWPNGGGGSDYVGPCPPAGEEHRYQFTVHALNQQLEAADDMSATEIIEILNLTSVDQSSVSGTYARTE